MGSRMLRLATLGVPMGGGTAPIYGVAWNGVVTNATLTRTDDAVGMVAAVGVDDQVVVNDFDGVYPYSEFTEVTDAYGNEFIDIPPFYIRKTADGAARTWQISERPHGPDWYLPSCFWDFDNSRPCHLQVGKYTASIDDGGRLESKPGLYPQINKNIVEFRTAAQLNGDEYQIECIHWIDALQVLFTIEFATLNSQDVMAGFTTGRYSDADVATVAEVGTNRIIVANATADGFAIGQAISIGTTRGGNQIFYGRTIEDIVAYDASNKAIEFDGDPVDIAVGNVVYNTGWRHDFGGWITASSGSLVSNTSGKYPCVYRGIEHPWGNIWRFIDLLNVNEGQAWVTLDARNAASNLFASPYESLNYVNSGSSGWIGAKGFDTSHPFAELPVEVIGSSSAPWGDYFYRSSGQRIALLGGGWFSGSYAGLSYWPLHYSSSDANVGLGARLCRKH